MGLLDRITGKKKKQESEPDLDGNINQNYANTLQAIFRNSSFKSEFESQKDTIIQQVPINLTRGGNVIKTNIANIKTVNVKVLNPAYILELMKVAEQYRERNSYLNDYMSQTVKENERLQQELVDTKETLV